MRRTYEKRSGLKSLLYLRARSYLVLVACRRVQKVAGTPQESMAEQLAGGALCPRSGGPDGNVMAAQAERFGHRSADTGPIPQRHPAHSAPQSLAPAVAVGARHGARSRWVAWWRIFCSE